MAQQPDSPLSRPGARTRIRACGVSDIGRVRSTNEDMFIADLERRLFAVADGMGGHSAGEVASRLAVEAMTEFIRRSEEPDPAFIWPYGSDPALSRGANRLRTAIQLANANIFRAGESREDYNRMGTTIVGLLVDATQVAIGHVGDSRLYLLAGGRLEQLTQDDSWAATVLAQDPTLSPADLARHPMRNVLTNVLGAREHVDVHLSERAIRAGDVMLLSSDGLHGAVDDEGIRDILLNTPDVEQAARRLVETAVERGSRDNVTAVVVSCQEEAS